MRRVQDAVLSRENLSCSLLAPIRALAEFVVEPTEPTYLPWQRRRAEPGQPPVYVLARPKRQVHAHEFSLLRGLSAAASLVVASCHLTM